MIEFAASTTALATSLMRAIHTRLDPDPLIHDLWGDRPPVTSHTEPAMLFRSKFGAIILIVVGALLLASNQGYLPRLGPLFHQWWPMLLVILGVSMLMRR